MTNAKTALFTPIKIGNLTLKHRIVFASLTQCRSEANGVPGGFQAEYYGQCATDGGLIIADAANMNKMAGSSSDTPGLYTKEQIEGLKKVTAAVHAKCGVIQSQLWHQGRAASSKYIGEKPDDPSPIEIKGIEFTGTYEYEVPREITVAEMKVLVKDYQQCALNSIEAGFDGTQFHAANSFFLDQFFNSSSNQRINEYDESPENHSRFFQILDGLIEVVGIERIFVRPLPWAAFLDMVEPGAVLYDDSYDFNQKKYLDPLHNI
ncbi:MAG: hypothetical protein EXX96DRAFT_580893 [Benjaminiella poitrasii]|nr:MAG: hypothetical protein EXX96DRAFT_580893 [Benjaminiella poitrasii]